MGRRLKVGVIGMGNQDTLSSIYEGGNSLGFRPIEDKQVLDQYTRLLRPQVAATFPLEQVQEATDLLESRDFFGKIVLTPGGAS